MQKSKRFIVSVLILGAYLLSACSGTTPVPSVVDDSSNGQLQEIVFTGAVESMGDGQWQISGQTISVDTITSVDANVQIGDIVRVEANVSGDGSVVALKIESSSGDDNANSNDGNSNDANANDDNANTNDNANDNTNANSNDNTNDNANSNDAPAGPAQEAFGMVEAITTDSITINGVMYSLANFTEFKGTVAVGDQVKMHVIVNADGTFTIREIEKSTGTGIGDDNGNSNDNGDDSNSNDDDNSNDNSNDDDSNDNGDDDDDDSNDNSDDDDDNDDDSNSNDD